MVHPDRELNNWITCGKGPMFLRQIGFSHVSPLHAFYCNLWFIFLCLPLFIHWIFPQQKVNEKITFGPLGYNLEGICMQWGYFVISISFRAHEIWIELWKWLKENLCLPVMNSNSLKWHTLVGSRKHTPFSH